MKRRTAIGLMGAAAIGAANPTIATTKQSGVTKLDLDPTNAQDLHYMHKKLNFALDDRLSYWYIRAVRYGLKDGIFTPFWNMHVGFVFQVIQLEEYRYRAKAFIKIFYSDLETGELKKTFHNPYTGAIIDVRQPGLVKSERTFGLHGDEAPAIPIDRMPKDGENRGAVSRDGNIGPAWIMGDDVWVNADMIYRSEMPNDANRLIQVNDWTTIHGSMTEVADPTVMSASATHVFNDINTFNHPWYGMDGLDAQSVSRGFGRKLATGEEMPDMWKKFMRATHPEVLADIPAQFEGW